MSKLSELFSLNKRDWLHGALVAIGTSIATSLGQLMEAWSANGYAGLPFGKVDLILSLKVALGAGIFYLLKNLFSNSNGVILKSDPSIVVKKNEDLVGGRPDDRNNPPPQP